MQKLVIDTNVLVSALITQSYPALIVDLLFIDDETLLYLSDEVFREYNEVLKRDKFSKYTGFLTNAESLLEDISMNGIIVVPKEKVEAIEDLIDNRFLELALECNADFLITGNTNDFTMSSFGQTKIVTPKEYWEKYR
jgi:putative PIN family toxin of toxin-antitoxin system